MKVYLDNNATTPISPAVKETMIGAMDVYGNPSSIHSFGVTARNEIELARKRVADALGCDADNVIFTSGGTEANNIAIQGVLQTTDKKHIITSKIEHHAVMNIIKNYEKKGYDVSWINVDENGIVDPEKIVSLLSEDTAVISIMTANNEVGAIQPIQDIVKKVKEYSSNIIFHTDAVQAFGKVKFKINDLGVDLLSVSSHKINGPKGVGALYIKKNVKIKPVSFGGHHERSLKPGTENTIGIIGFGKAAQLSQENLEQKINRQKELKDRLRKGIESNVSNIKINGLDEKVLPNTLNVSFKNVEGESILMMLDMEGVGASTGSACSSGTLEPSYVLLAMGLDHATAQGSIRFSLGEYTTAEEIDYVIQKLPPIIEKLRKMSPLER